MIYVIDIIQKKLKAVVEVNIAHEPIFFSNELL
jgi:hypothetical protein